MNPRYTDYQNIKKGKKYFFRFDRHHVSLSPARPHRLWLLPQFDFKLWILFMRGYGSGGYIRCGYGGNIGRCSYRGGSIYGEGSG